MAWMYLDSSIMGDKETGPLTDQQFIKMIELKKIKSKTQIFHPKHTKGEWVQGRHVPAFKKTVDRLKVEQQEEKERQKAARVEEIAEAQREKAKERLEEVRQAAAITDAQRDQFEPRRYGVAEWIAKNFEHFAYLGLCVAILGVPAMVFSVAAGVAMIVWGVGTYVVNLFFAQVLSLIHI